MNAETKTIPLIPSWRAAARIYLACLQNGTPEGIASAEAGIMEMADAIDQQNVRVKDMATALEPFAHPDLSEILGGTRPMDGEDENDAIIYQRNNAKLTVGNFRAAAEAIK